MLFAVIQKKVIVISFFTLLAAIFSPIWSLFVHWLSIFASPFDEPEMLWVIIPIWGNWFFAEFFQEKHGTSFGNAISNGAIAIFAGMDWMRYLYRLLADGITQFSFGILLKFIVALGVLAYGIYIIIQGARSRKVVYLIGRIRWVTYVLVMFTPIVYLHNISTGIGLNFQTLLAIVVFFPLYYYVVEFFDRITPEPTYYKEGKA